VVEEGMQFDMVLQTALSLDLEEVDASTFDTPAQ
jgi:hypothetical protein